MKSGRFLIVFSLFVNIIWAQELPTEENNQKSTQASIEFKSQWKTSGRCKSASIMGSYAYLTNNNKIDILNISDPAFPEFAGEAELSSSFLSEDIFGKGNYVYVANYNMIYVFDVSNPWIPDSIDSFEVESIINDIYIVGDLLYVIASYDFYILDISNSSTLSQIGKLTLPEASLGLTRFHVEGDFAYIGSWSDGLYVIDISEASNPILYGRFLERSYIVFAQGNFAYVADSRYLYILDITDKVIPEIVSRRDNMDIPHDIFVDENYIYVATEGGLVIYNKGDLSFVTSYSVEDNSERLFIKDGLIYISSNTEGLNILQFLNPDGVDELNQNLLSFRLEQNYPNPFNPSTTIKYSIPAQSSNEIGQNVKLVVYDLLGKEVEVLVSSKQKSGNYEVIFNPRDLSSGVYLYRLVTEAYSLSKKMLFVK